MKQIIIATVMLLNAANSFSQIKKAELVATGLTCSMCSNAINKAFKAMPEVEKVDIDLNKNLFTITLKKGNSLTPKNFKDKVEKAGFFIGSLVITMPFENFAVGDNNSIKTSLTTYTFIDSKTQTLQGDKKIKILDKGFVTQKEYKVSLKAFVKYPSFAETKDGQFHVKTI